MNEWEFRAQRSSAARTAADIGAAGYMPKPIDFSDLLSQVERYCRVPRRALRLASHRRRSLSQAERV